MSADAWAVVIVMGTVVLACVAFGVVWWRYGVLAAAFLVAALVALYGALVLFYDVIERDECEAQYGTCVETTDGWQPL